MKSYGSLLAVSILLVGNFTLAVIGVGQKPNKWVPPPTPRPTYAPPTPIPPTPRPTATAIPPSTPVPTPTRIPPTAVPPTPVPTFPQPTPTSTPIGPIPTVGPTQVVLSAFEYSGWLSVKHAKVGTKVLVEISSPDGILVGSAQAIVTSTPEWQMAVHILQFPPRSIAKIYLDGVYNTQITLPD